MLLSVALVSFLVCLRQIAQFEAEAAGAVEEKYTCPHGWTRYGSKKCLKYLNELQDYERAQATCRSKNHGTLVTIHSHDEQNFVYSYIHSIAASSTPIWLGAKQIDFESILWLDKTENSYTNWAPSEPSHPDEICIAINPRNGMWHDVMCTEANVPACERAPTTQWPFFVAFCSEGWFQFNDEKCVRIISSQALNFYESQELCRSKYNSKLLSIKTDRESEFLHNLIKFRDVKLPVWLGAVQNDFSSFNWIDKSDVTFTNWAEGEPNDPDHACLSMTASGGKWSDNDCKEQKLILCQKAVPEDSLCETGWLQFRQDKCYRFVHIRLAFDDAESLCNNLYGGHLPSIHSQEEQFMISQFLASVNVKNGSEIWLGGRQMDFHNFNWGDGSLFNYSYWEHGEPNFPAEKCIEMSWRNGRWNDINCRLKRAVLCERQVSSRHLIKPNLYQPTTCLETNCTTPPTSLNSQTNQSDLIVVDASQSPSVTPAVLLSNSGSSSASSNGGSSSSMAGSSLANEQAAAPVQNFSIPTQSEASIANSSIITNRTTSSQQSFPANEEGLILPLDDKPIKVITSIMHREQSPTIDPFISVNGTAGELNNGTFIHYNLPPPLSNKPDQEIVVQSIRKQPEQSKQVASALPAGAGLDPNLKDTPLSQKSFDPDTTSLLDKLKPATTASVPVSALNSLTTTSQTPASSLSQPINLSSTSSVLNQQIPSNKEAPSASSVSSDSAKHSSSPEAVVMAATAPVPERTNT